MSTWNWRKVRGTMSCRRKNLDSIVCFALFSWSIFIFVFCLRLLFCCCCKLLCFISLKQVVFWRSLCESVSLLLFADHFLRELITRSLKHFGEHAGGPDISICLVSSVSRHQISRGRLLLCEVRAFLLWFLVSFFGVSSTWARWQSFVQTNFLSSHREISRLLSSTTNSTSNFVLFTAMLSLQNCSLFVTWSLEGSGFTQRRSLSNLWPFRLLHFVLSLSTYLWRACS